MTTDIQIALTEWEVKNVVLPPVTTLTLYNGKPSISELTERLRGIIETNPWVCARLGQKKGSAPTLNYASQMDAATMAGAHIAPKDTALSLDLSYKELVSALEPYQSLRSKVLDRMLGLDFSYFD